MPGRNTVGWTSVGDAARRCETTVRTLQYYDRIGLLVAERDDSGRRRYHPEQLDRLRRIQLLTSAGLRLDEVGAALDRQDGRPLVETYSEQVRLLEIAELRLRCQRIVLAAVTQVLREHPQARVPENVVVATMSLDRTLLRHPGVENPGARAPAGLDIDVDRVITTYFEWKACAVQALLLVDNDVPADSRSGRRLGREWRATTEYALRDQPAGTGDLYRATEQSEHTWPPEDRVLHRRTKDFLEQCLFVARQG
ncbi:MerR family transcriptional regulator [Nocardia flavorosea]|uniref:MerR family transcriptional regulator n=1 Tax=Nocardia flavorosea TaxID=53429 RepID=A0A846YKT4_9NOCA|nr:MerR family transcriptional regulator [Nocardia flavorosea]NKY58240.1 MerR family transcriptional regulator [Nocardia flavorosea]